MSAAPSSFLLLVALGGSGSRPPSPRRESKARAGTENGENDAEVLDLAGIRAERRARSGAAFRLPGIESGKPEPREARPRRASAS
jgi:hypothetical protein